MRISFLETGKTIKTMNVAAAALALISLSCLAKAAETPVALYAPYWRLGHGFETTLGVNNTRPKPITITPRVYTSSVEELPATPFTVGPIEARTFSLREVLVDRTNGGTGHVELQFSGSPIDIAAQLVIDEEKPRRLWNHVFEPKQRYLSSRYEGVFAGVGAFEGATLALTNICRRACKNVFFWTEAARVSCRSR